MLNKVAFRNTRKNFKEYAIYFFTLVFAVCIFYMFNSIDAQKEIMEVTSTTNSSMQALTKILSYISVFVSFILGFLIIYANNYFIKRRKKEIGIYQTLGMDKRKISLILVLETMLLAIFALFVRLCLGVFLSQFMSVFTAKIFEADLSAYKFIFSFTALIKSIIYFGIIFLIVIIFNVIIINKYKLIDLIYGSRKNEKLKIKNIKTSVFIFIISVICLATAYYMINARGLLQIDLIFLLNLIIGIVGTVLFFLSLTGFLIKVLQKKKKIYYKDLNMFVLRQINSKINTNFISMSVVCILLLLTIGILSCGISIENILSKDLKGMIKYDVTFMSNAKKISLKNNALDGNNSFYDTLPEDLKLEKYFKSKNEYITYNLKEYKYSDLNYINDKNESYLNDFKIDFLKLSDFNNILKLDGKITQKIDDSNYIIVSNGEKYKSYINKILDSKKEIIVNNKKLKPIKIANVRLKNFSDVLTIVVNDKYVDFMDKNEIILNINFTNYEEHSQDYEKAISKYKNEHYLSNEYFDYVISKLSVYNASISSKAIIAFLAIYLGLIFLITCSAILAIQQLSEASDNKERYLLLNKLGAKNDVVNKALFSQIAIYFLLPLTLAVIHSFFGLMAANSVIKLAGKLDVSKSIIMTSLAIISIYGLYFVLTYIGSKNIIKVKNNAKQ